MSLSPNVYYHNETTKIHQLPRVYFAKSNLTRRGNRRVFFKKNCCKIPSRVCVVFLAIPKKELSVSIKYQIQCSKCVLCFGFQSWLSRFTRKNIRVALIHCLERKMNCDWQMGASQNRLVLEVSNFYPLTRLGAGLYDYATGLTFDSRQAGLELFPKGQPLLKQRSATELNTHFVGSFTFSRCSLNCIRTFSCCFTISSSRFL